MSNENDDDPMATTFCKIPSRKIILRYLLSTQIQLLPETSAADCF